MIESNEQLVLQLLKLKTKNSNRLNKAKRAFAHKNRTGMISNADLLALYRQMIADKQIAASPAFEKMIRKRKVRTLSGVAPVAVLTKPFPCPGNCLYCPTEKDMPKSYLSNEPAVMRAIQLKFNPFKQVEWRIKALEMNGHDTDKIELIIMGGTWSYFPKSYQRSFVKKCFDACNGTISKTLLEAQKLNETAKHRIVALTLETRPDYVNEKEIKYWRELGATKVELGVQAIDDKILTLNKRGHGVDAIINATKLFKQAGFKVCYHLMPNLPGATPAKDLKLFRKLFEDENFQPDFIKIYPTVVTKDSELFALWEQGKYKPYSFKQLKTLLIELKKIVPDNVRIIRLIRDIPKSSIIAGNTVTNLRELLQKEMLANGLRCKCIRCREAREDIKKADEAKLFVKKIQASGDEELFLQFASKDKKKLYAFLRLRLQKKSFIPEIDGCALIREIHTYGRLMPIDGKEKGLQHQGFGTKLTLEAEKIAAEAGFEKIAVISGVGVRGFYRKLGYELNGTYMVKKLD